MRCWWIVGITALLWGCGFGDQTLDEVDPGAAPLEPTWSAHVEPIMYRRCTACHSEDAQPGEVDGYGFETCDKLKTHEEEFRESTFEEKTMPPGGAERLTSAEVLRVVHVDVGDDGDGGIADIGGIPGAAHADFEDQRVHAGICKKHQCSERAELEIRQFLFAANGFDPFE